MHRLQDVKIIYDYTILLYLPSIHSLILGVYLEHHLLTCFLRGHLSLYCLE